MFQTLQETSKNLKKKKRNGRIIELIDKDFKTAIINMLKHLKENMNIMKREVESVYM